MVLNIAMNIVGFIGQWGVNQHNICISRRFNLKKINLNMMINWYKRFCCGIYYFLKEKTKSTVPTYATFMFTLFLSIFLVYGADRFISVIFKTDFKISKFIMYGLLIIIGIPNYIYIFKDDKFLSFYNEKISNLNVISIILIIITLCVIMILLGVN